MCLVFRCSVFEPPLYQTVQLFRARLFFNFLLTGCHKSNKYCEGVILLCYKRSVIPSMIVSLLEHDDLKVRFANLVKGIGDLHSYIIQCPSLIRKVNYSHGNDRLDLRTSLYSRELSNGLILMVEWAVDSSGLFNLTLLLRCTDVTTFCMQ